jgi:hypothetical protein
MPIKNDYDYSQFYYGRYKKLFRSGYLDQASFGMASEVDEFAPEPEKNSDNNAQGSHRIVDIRRSSAENFPHKKRRGKGIIITLCALIMCVSILMLSVDYFSAKGIVGELKSVFSFAKEECANYYAINMGHFDTLTEARQLSDAIRSRGAAGYITNDGAYNVLASCYVNYDDAKGIADINDAEVFTIRVFPKNKKELPSKLRDGYITAAGYEKTVYDTLYSLSNRLDEEEITEADCIQPIVELKGRIKAKTDVFMELSEGYTDAYTTEIRVSIIACIAALDNLTNSALIRPNLLCDIRYTYLMVLNMA